ncbi:hypothetical protein CAR_c04450 [Carnobacterium sp. 17-4]|nr:hypothetical protein CAR_c04450 [Carnobacterium sp. 17-4]
MIGNNGVGKTLLLETYAKTNDFFIEKVMSTKFINEIADKMEFETKILNKHTKPYVEVNKWGLKKNSEEQVDGHTISFEVKSKLLNKEEIFSYTDKNVGKMLSEIQKVIEQDILFINVQGEQNNLIKNFGPKFVIPILKVCEDITYNVELISPMITNDTDNEIDSNSFSAIGDSLSIDFGDKTFHGRVSTRKWVTREENILYEQKILNNEYDIIHKELKNIISDVLKDLTIKENDLKVISYIPSERIVSMSKFIEKQVSENNYNGLRYSEEKFAKEYISFKEYYSLTSDKLKEEVFFNETYKKLLGGSPQFDETGEIIGIKDTNGIVVNRTLFSTKQNKIYPFFMLHGNYNRKTYSRFNGRAGFHNLRSRSKTIIIEEPEANLSTKGILEMANYIYELNKKNQIILSTHSDVFLSQINNLYLKNSEIDKVSGYEILDTTIPFFIKKLEVSGKLGVSSDFITSQLELLYENTESIQHEIDRLE